MLRFISIFATFEVGIGKDDIQEPTLLPEDWYGFEITRDPYEAKNSAWTEAGEKLSLDEAFAINEKASMNIVINGRLLSDVPEFSGRTFTKWLSLPNKFDNDRWMNNGQPRTDWKADQIYKWLEALQGESEGTKVNFVLGQKCMVYIEQGPDQSGENIVNQISMNSAPKPLSEAPLGIGSGGLEGDTHGESPFLGDEITGGLLGGQEDKVPF